VAQAQAQAVPVVLVLVVLAALPPVRRRQQMSRAALRGSGASVVT
jgi:hypothetical protein